MYNRDKKQNKNMNTRSKNQQYGGDNRFNNRNSRQRQRRKRVNIDKNIEVLIVNNTFGRLIYNNPRISTAIDMPNYGDDQYITVGELKSFVSSAKKLFESFEVLIVEILDDEYELEDVLNFVGLLDKYEEFFGNNVKNVDTHTINDYILRVNADKFESVLESVGRGLRQKIIQNCIVLVKTNRLSDLNKIHILERYVDEDTIDDIRTTELDEDIEI